MKTQAGTGRYVRVVTHDRALADIEEDILRAAHDGARVLVDTADGSRGAVTEADSRNAAIAEWAGSLSREHALEWSRVGRDVLFTSQR